MARLTPAELEELKKKEQDLYDSQYPEESEDPVDLDETYVSTMGNDLADDESLDIVEEVEGDEEAILKKEINKYIAEDDDLEDPEEDL